VKALAAQTTKAAEEIGTQISSVQVTTEESVVAIKGIGMTIDRISEITTILAAAVEQQGAAARQIAHNVHQVAESTSDVAGNLSAVNRGASQTGDASRKVLTSAQSLAAESSRLKAKVVAFLATVRAA
jgi:methyl-accepting chemotaxis protein